MPPGGCLISPCGRVLSHPVRRPRHRVAACVQYRTGLSRRMISFSVTSGRLPDFYDSQESRFRSLFQSLPDVRFTLRLASAEYVQSALSHHLPHIGTSFAGLIPRGRSVPAVCVPTFPHCHRVYPCGGRAPSNMPGAGCLLAVRPIDALPDTRFHSGENHPGGHGSGIPPAGVILPGVPYERKKVRETGIEPAFSWQGSQPTRPREVFRPHPGPGGMPRYSPHGSEVPPSESGRAAAVLFHVPRYIGVLVRPAVRRGSVG